MTDEAGRQEPVAIKSASGDLRGANGPISGRDVDRFEALAMEVASAARRTALRYFRTPLEVDTKGDLSPVTRADREIELEARRLIEAAEPKHGIFGEEHGRLRPEARIQWVLDPIDGTKSFMTGMPLFGTLIAVLDGERPILGVVDMPVLDERWVGRPDRRTVMNAQPCRTSARTCLSEAILYTTTVDTFSGQEAETLQRLSRACRMRRFGGDCYAYALLASGHVDIVLEACLQPYDYMALVPVIEGAGGIITDWVGRPLSLQSSGHVLAAATPQLHAQAMKLIAYR
jgi:histidinol phosphatase-like enzyme (inositol monophosphatase family)